MIYEVVMNKTALVFCSLILLQGCENPNQLVLGSLVAGGIVALQAALADDCKPGREITLSDGSSVWDSGNC